MKKVNLLLLALLCALSTYAQNYRYVNADKLNLRAEPSKNSQVVLILHNTAEVDLLEEVDDDWARVNAYGYEGYVASAFLVYDIGERKGEAYFTLPTSTNPQAATSTYTYTYTTTVRAANTSTTRNVVSVYICDSKSAYAYHNSTSCRGLNRCTHGVYKVTKLEAIESYGRQACKICY
jgi:uncharacterized protein YgiM (DUF1202 family)